MNGLPEPKLENLISSRGARAKFLTYFAGPFTRARTARVAADLLRVAIDLLRRSSKVFNRLARALRDEYYLRTLYIAFDRANQDLQNVFLDESLAQKEAKI